MLLLTTMVVRSMPPPAEAAVLPTMVQWFKVPPSAPPPKAAALPLKRQSLTAQRNAPPALVAVLSSKKELLTVANAAPPPAPVADEHALPRRVQPRTVFE